MVGMVRLREQWMERLAVLSWMMLVYLWTLT
jgi:hypothetical protein